MLGAKDDLYSLRNNTNPTPSRTMTISSRLRDTPNLHTPYLHTPSSKIVVIADDGLQHFQSKDEKTSPSYTTPPSSRLRATSNNAPTPTHHLGSNSSNSSNSPLSSPILTAATNNNLPHSSPKLTSSSDPNDPNAPPSPYESKSFKLNRKSPPRSRSKRLTTTPTRLKTTSSPVKTSHTSDHTTPTHPTTTRATRQVSSAPRLKSSSAPVFSAAFTSPKLSSQPNPDAPPSPYENKSFRLRGMDSPPRNSRNSRRTPPHTISSVPRLRVSPYKNNSFKLKHTSSGGQSQSAERSKRSFSSRSLFGSSTSSKTNSAEKTKTKQNVFNGLNLNDDSDKDESSFSLYSLSSRSISPPPMTFGLETTTPRKVEIPFFDPKFAGSTRKERAKKEDAFAKFEAIFAGTERSPTKTLKKSNSKESTSTSTSSSTSVSPFSSTTAATTSSSSTTTLKIKRKLKPKVKVSFETLGNTRRVSTVTGHVRNTSIGTTSMRSPRVSQRPPRPPQTNTTTSSLPPPPSIPTANTNGVMFFKTGIMAYELLDAAENLVETKNTMTVTGRTAMKRVFPETKNGLKIEVNGTNVALYRVNNTVYAIGTECPHRKGPLHLGDIEDVEKHGMCVVCPWHRWTFRLTDGLLVKPDRGSGKDTPKSVVFPVELDLDTDEISVGFEEFGDNLFNGDIDF